MAKTLSNREFLEQELAKANEQKSRYESMSDIDGNDIECIVAEYSKVCLKARSLTNRLERLRSHAADIWMEELTLNIANDGRIHN